MPKMIIIECSDEEADRMVEQLKNMIAEYEYHPYHGPGKVYEFELLRIDQCGIKGMPDIRSQSLDHAPSNGSVLPNARTATVVPRRIVR